MNKIKISAVSYTNTRPFVYGLQHAQLIDQIELSLDIPSDCALKLIEGRVDIGLIPVAVLPEVPHAEIVSNYCIGSEGAVNSVFIFSNLPIAAVKTVKLDPQSRTSNNLAKVLFKHHWKKEVHFTKDPETTTDAIVLIGDRTFTGRDQYKYAYDMGAEWKQFTGLPFVYAAWVANKPITKEFTTAFNQALKYGLDNRKTLLQKLPVIDGFNLEEYLMHKLDFDLTENKRKALKLFLEYIKGL